MQTFSHTYCFKFGPKCGIFFIIGRKFLELKKAHFWNKIEQYWAYIPTTQIYFTQVNYGAVTNFFGFQKKI